MDDAENHSAARNRIRPKRSKKRYKNVFNDAKGAENDCAMQNPEFLLSIFRI